MRDEWYDYSPDDHYGAFDDDLDVAEDDDYVALDEVVVLRATEKAVLIVLPTSGRECWAPKSQLHPKSDVQDEGDAGTFVIKRWWLERQPWFC